MNNDLIFSKLIDKLAERAEYLSNKMDGGVDSSYGFGYMQSLVYNMIHEVPGVAEYVQKNVELLTKLHQMEHQFRE